MKKKLGKRLSQMIINAVKMEGTFDPNKILYLFEESLTFRELSQIKIFLQWVHDNNRTFGTANIEDVYKEWYDLQVNQDFKITLAKHIDEDRILMCWYNVETSAGKYQFRSDAIVTKEEEKLLRSYHCTTLLSDELLNRCIKILTPYKEKILQLVKNYKNNIVTYIGGDIIKL